MSSLHCMQKPRVTKLRHFRIAQIVKARSLLGSVPPVPALKVMLSTLQNP